MSKGNWASKELRLYLEERIIREKIRTYKIGPVFTLDKALGHRFYWNQLIQPLTLRLVKPTAKGFTLHIISP
jgi:hypothetical protein